MTDSHVDALVVTPPNGNEKITLLNTRGENAEVVVQSKAGGVAWMLENLPEMSYLLVYGTTSASAVRVDGKVLPNVAISNFESMPIGWTTDSANNRLVLRLPSRQIEQSEPIIEIEVVVLERTSDLSKQRWK